MDRGGGPDGKALDPDGEDDVHYRSNVVGKEEERKAGESQRPFVPSPETSKS